MQNFFWGIGFIYLFIGCKSNSTEPGSAPGTEVRGETPDNSDAIFLNDIAFWTDSTLKLSTTKHKLQLEVEWNDDSLQTRSFSVTPGFLADYAKFLYWSPDSTKILDIGSYGFLALNDSSGTRLVAGEPDSEVAIIDREHNRRKRLIFGGPSMNILNGKWINHSEVVVLGTFNNATTVDTLLWRIDIEDDLFHLYNFDKAQPTER